MFEADATTPKIYVYGLRRGLCFKRDERILLEYKYKVFLHNRSCTSRRATNPHSQRTVIQAYRTQWERLGGCDI